jgi:hypothetical protein
LNKKILALGLLFILTAICVTSVSTVKAQTSSIGTGQWITKYTIADAQTGENILTRDFTTNTISGTGYILENEELEVTATINIGTNDPSADLNLVTSMLHSSSQSVYWAIQTSAYSQGSSNPNSNTLQIPELQGTLVVICYGLTQSNVVEQSGPNGITLNVPYPITLIGITDPSGNVLDQIKPNLINADIENYLNLLSTREASLKSYQSSGVEPGFVTIYKNTLTQSETLNNDGFTDGAIGMLNAINVPAPPTAASTAFYIPLAVVLAVVAALFAFMFMRIRGRISYFQLVVEDQIKDLEGLTMRASKIDRTMSANLENVKDSLKRLVGA